MRKVLPVLAVLGALAVTVPNAHAVLFTLTDLNSTFKVDTDYVPGQWYVDGVAEMYQQGFWWRVGSTGGEGRVGDLYTTAVQPLPNMLQIDFNEDRNFDIRVTYVLTGGPDGSHTSDVAESIRIHNKAGGNLDFHFFQYADFDLGGTTDNDELSFPNANLVSQWDTGGSLMLSETVVVPTSSHHEGSIYPSIFDSLEDDSPTTLSDLPPFGGGSIFGNVAWGFQWDTSLGGTDLIISKDKRLSPVPEPGTLVLLGLGLFGAEVARRLRKRS